MLMEPLDALQKEENKAKAKKAAEAEEAQKKLADIMVEAQKKVRSLSTAALQHLHCNFCASSAQAF